MTMSNESNATNLEDELTGLRRRHKALTGKVLTNAQICEREQVFRRIKEVKSELGL